MAALAAGAAIRGAALNVRINCAGLSDKAPAQPLLDCVREILAQTEELEKSILEQVDKNIAL